MTAPTIPTMISTMRPNPPPSTILPRHEASDRADHKPYDYAMFHRSDSRLLLDEFAAFQIVNERAWVHIVP